MFDILITSTKSSDPTVPDSETLTTHIATGIKDGTITTLHSCVEYVNSEVEEGYSVNGDDVQGIFKAAVKEAKSMNAAADKMAAEGSSVDEITAAIEAGTYFTIDDILELKVEEYETTDAWLAAMVAAAGTV